MIVMFSLKDLTALLDRWEEWSRIKGAADRVPEIERRLGAIEDKLAGKGGQLCPQCGSLNVQLEYSRPTEDEKKIFERWRCGDCEREFHKIH